jgi:hypothetical protein
MAGEPETEVYTRAGLLFWLLHYGAIHLAVLVLGRQEDRSPGWRVSRLLPGLGMSGMALGSVGLLWVDSTPGHLVAFLLIVEAGVAVLSLGWRGWRRRKGRAIQPGPGAQ